ncbi:MAG: type II toxin-antitoxin system VapC family toxin [Burkholderiales bacterium]|nr:type II toxin-antitoxin system VapC family toxin [Burkholderiales bacterium]MDE1928142.1 type II toxin-antitoxin system VapC family toxin [Burkholderiales bacterium]MDE2158463.1 type II toxin-antitoxin system VapC family toxin [Burkholderiales bacterium]MDE2502665.1 type II toxin-antitoxin system VapC family toxin [Burkholderiales bacterium]
MIVLDTNVVSELRKRPRLQHARVCAWSQAHPASAFYLTPLTIMEIERGILMDEAKATPRGPLLRTWFNALRIAYAGHVLPFNEGAAIRAAQLAGGNRPSVDLMIAAIALEFGYAVATRNVAHFNFPGLAVVDPWA